MSNKVEDKVKTVTAIYNPMDTMNKMSDRMNKIDAPAAVFDPFKEMVEMGIPVWRAEFHSSVNNSDGTPEYYFSADSAAPSRHVKMWWVKGDGLLCLHKDKYFIVPSASVKFAKFEQNYEKAKDETA